jgi:hypothetical protein
MMLHEGTMPAFQWFVNDTAFGGATDTVCTYVPLKSDTVVCRLTSNENCAEPLTVFSHVIVVTVNPIPEITSPSTISAVCSEFLITDTLTSDIDATIFTWTRAEFTGITPQTGSGSGTKINETLTNSADYPIPVTYIVTATANGCSSTQEVTVTVNPKRKPKITIEVVPRN